MILTIILLTTICSLLIAIILYGIGYYGGSKLMMKLNDSPNKVIKKIKKLFNKYSKSSIFIVRLIPFSRSYVSIFSGICRQNFYIYLISSFVGILLWNTIYVCLGISVFMNFDILISYYQEYKLLILIVLSATIIAIFYRVVCSIKR